MNEEINILKTSQSELERQLGEAREKHEHLEEEKVTLEVKMAEAEEQKEG